jgi:hypothetical protein
MSHVINCVQYDTIHVINVNLSTKYNGIRKPFTVNTLGTKLIIPWECNSADDTDLMIYVHVVR